VKSIDMDVWHRFSQPRRDELIDWIDEQVGHHVIGVDRIELHRRFSRRTLRLSGIVKVETKPGQWSAVHDPVRRTALARFTADVPLRTPPPWWPRRPRHRATSGKGSVS